MEAHWVYIHFCAVICECIKSQLGCMFFFYFNDMEAFIFSRVFFVLFLFLGIFKMFICSKIILSFPSTHHTTHMPIQESHSSSFRYTLDSKDIAFCSRPELLPTASRVNTRFRVHWPSFSDPLLQGFLLDLHSRSFLFY